jgi:hypothetical protein
LWKWSDCFEMAGQIDVIYIWLSKTLLEKSALQLKER